MATRRAAAIDRGLAEEIGILLPHVRRLIWYAAERRLLPHQLSMFGWQMLWRIDNQGPMSQIELARATAQHPAGVCRTIDELAERGFVRRVDDPEDRRKMQVRLTRRGRSFLRDRKTQVVSAVLDALAPLSPKERLALRELLRKLAAGNE
jgi:DNA-binding MarR family transcriptional regulator